MRKARIIGDVFSYLVLVIMSFLWLFPIMWLVLCSFRGEPGSALDYFWPKSYSLENYINLFKPVGIFSFPRWFFNTLLVALATCAISTLLVLMIAYAFSRLRFPTRRPWMNVMLILGMFPGFMSMIAIYFLIKMIGLSQSLWALILIYSGAAGMGYYISKGFFDTIPKALDEAARIEGATNATVFWKITLPLSKPIVIYTILTSFMGPWMDFIMVSVIMRENYEYFTVAYGLYRMLERERIYTYFRQFCAGSVLVSIPITALFIIMQKFYVEGVTGGAVKG